MNVAGILSQKGDIFKKMCFMYKCSNNLVPNYISDIVPPLVGEVTNYPLRNRNNISSIYTRTDISKKSCIPSSVSDWNNLNRDIRAGPSPRFKKWSGGKHVRVPNAREGESTRGG